MFGNFLFSKLPPDKNFIIAIDEALELFDDGKSKRADSILHRLENYYGKRNVEQIYYFRKLNRY